VADSDRKWEPDTSIGGRRLAFPATPASAILGVQSDDPVVRARAFSAVVRAYWKPAYKRIRLRFRKSNEAAKDLTQAFFTRALERGVFAAYDPSQARFRTYVRRCLDNFVANAEEHDTALKRGGGALALALDFEHAEEELAKSGQVEDPTDERLFDRDWVAGLHAASLAALREELEQGGVAVVQLRAFERYDLVDESERPTYGALAADLGIKPTDVTNHLHAVRKRLRRIVLTKLREVTSSDEEYRSEAIELLGVDPDADAV
jgi:DNA-directed RNA polymerase specialized sigma24 family protein